MESVQRLGALAALVLLSSLGPGGTFSQITAAAHRPAQSATRVLAVDLRELTSLHDIPDSGEVFFNRIAWRQRRTNQEYDLAICYSAAPNWKSAFGGPYDDRARHVFAVELGTYVIERGDICNSSRAQRVTAINVSKAVVEIDAC